MFTVKGKQFYNNGKPSFYMADTCWSAFTNIFPNEWKYYLQTRYEQGFNVIQLDLLRQWDASTTNTVNLNWEPFKVIQFKDGQRTYDYSQLNENYFDHVEDMLKVMETEKLTPSLVLLWCNYLPDTWVHNVASSTNIMPLKDAKNYVDYVTKRFAKYHPIYFLSGDTDFPDNSNVETYYQEALKIVRKNDPQALVSMHIAGERDLVPENLLNQLDFFVYQSGHGATGEPTAESIPQTLLKNHYNKPMIDTEVCYEFMPKFSPEMNARFSKADVRRTSWKAIMAGAFSGITYGAHGIWQWFRKGEFFPLQYPDPADWRQALSFTGVMDITKIKEIISQIDLNNTKSVMFNDKDRALRVGNDTYLIYLPMSKDVDLGETNYSSIKMLNLKSRYVYYPEVIDQTIKKIDQPGDYLLIIENK